MPKLKENIKLSILILSIPSRFDIVKPLIEKVLAQIGDREDVEVISLMDNKSLHIWEKRNALMGIARGTHLTWLDDDDDIADNYVDKLTETIETNPNVDVISFNQTCYLNGMEARVFARMGNPHEDVIPEPQHNRLRDTLRPPYHWCCWKTSLALSEPFRASFSHGDKGQSTEDIDWLKRLYPKVNSDVYLDNFLHIYRWSLETTESVL
tara:strand:+ start:27915 stop:28541 length:627 start_codon:yes stop_codon:yes gene_type:complete